MTRSRYKIYEEAQPHFLTMSIVDWTPLFTNPEIVTELLGSIRFTQKERELTLYAWVVMEHHLHLIAKAPDLSKTIKEFKSYTARTIVDYLKQRRSYKWLKKLQKAKLAYKQKSKYQVWQEGSHPQQILNEEMLIQKIDYIHYNPVRRGYVDEPQDWRYSSARDYEGEKGLLEVRTKW
jgi:putative transposase